MRRAVLAVCGCLCLLLAWILPPILQEKDSKSSSLGEGQLTLRTETEAEGASSSIHFLEHRSADSGVNFFYAGGPSSWQKMTEQNGGGIAAFDADSDGQLDLFCVNGMPPEEPQHAELCSNRLFRGQGGFKFLDVTSAAGMTHINHGQGCATGDYNNDGFCDLFVACYGANSLWRNNGDGTFDNVTDLVGVGDTGFATSAAFADLDQDGNLDLFVVNYLNWSPDGQHRDRLQSPMDFAGQPDLLYRNTGDGGFEEIGNSAGIAIAGSGKGLAVAIADLDLDDRLDVYVANDTTRNFLFRNRGAMLFQETGVESGVAVSQSGAIGSSMGVAIADYNLDGRPDLFVSNFAQEVNDVFMNLGAAGFVAQNAELRLDSVSIPQLGFGIVCADFDLNLWPDLFVANGHLWDERAAGGEYAMLPTILRNENGMRFTDASSNAGSYFKKRWLGRAVATGDLDNDGDTDLIISHLMEPPAVLENRSHRQFDSKRVILIGTNSSRQPLGCAVKVVLNCGTTLHLTVPSGGSFQSSSDTTLIVPTGQTGKIQSVTVTWSTGRREAWHTFSDVEATDMVLLEGSGVTTAR